MYHGSRRKRGLTQTGFPLRRETFQAQIGQDAHYLAAVANCYTLAQAKATLEGPTAFAAIRELLADCHEELSLHAFYAEVFTRRTRAQQGTASGTAEHISCC